MLRTLRDFFDRLLRRLRLITRIDPEERGLFGTLISRDEKRRQTLR
jgi:hypothetical protein